MHADALPRDLASYLRWEDARPDRHEWVRQQVRAVADDRRVENLVKGNVAASLQALLRSGPCLHAIGQGPGG